MFNIGDRVAHPLHGAGTISEIEHKRIDGIDRDYYVLRITKGDIRVMVPVDSCEAVGLRAVICPEEVEELFRQFPALELMDDASWNKRYRDNMGRIRSGDLLEVASVIKSLLRREAERGLSTGERKMLSSAKQILLSELVLSLNISYEEADAKVCLAFQ